MAPIFLLQEDFGTKEINREVLKEITLRAWMKNQAKQDRWRTVSESLSQGQIQVTF
ncbi:hypothetical protein [Bacillus sp. JJ1562]|uniref:hypothetical protein n=1 Tax=Bacillus sp. JJ1562 TaxID=3122960 RepID=UPI003001DED6